MLSDHKNLEYFMTVRKLTEQQIRWSLILSQFDFKIRHIDGKDNVLADALSRRDQDLPASDEDDRVRERHLQLLKPYMVEREGSPLPATLALAALVQPLDAPFDLFSDWDQAVQYDRELCTVYKAVKKEH